MIKNKTCNYRKLHLKIEKKRNWYFIKDPIHNEINFSKNELWLYKLVNTPEFQRLHKIKQLGFTFHNFPTATHSRLSHSLGTYEMANKFIKHFKQHGYLNDKDQIEINIALAASLLHDIGHGPYSHTFEKVFGFNHEEMTQRLISSKDSFVNNLLREKALEDKLDENFYVKKICGIFQKTGEYSWIETFISSDIDVDRLDYINRDRYFSGSTYGYLDHNLLVKWSVLIKDGNKRKFLFVNKAKFLIFNFLVCRQYMFLELYTNAISLIYEELLVLILNMFRKDFKNLKDQDKYKDYEFLLTDSKSWDIKDFLWLTDEKIDYLFEMLRNSNNEDLKKIINLLDGYVDKTDFELITLKESEFEKYENFASEFGEEDFFSKKIVPFESSVKNSLNCYDMDKNKEEIITLSLKQEKNKSFFIKIITKSKYINWIKFK